MPDVSHEYPPGEWTVDDIQAALSAPEQYPVPQYEEAEVWESVANDPITEPAVRELLSDARDLVDQPVPRIPATAYLEYERTGTRGVYEDPANSRKGAVNTLVAAECIEREGEYLDTLLDYAWAICEETTWTMPAIIRDDQKLDGLPTTQPVENREVGIHGVNVAATLAEAVYVLGDELHPALVERIREEVERRIVRPYEERDDLWWLTAPTMPNQNAVNHFGVVTAALYLLDDTERQAEIVAKAARHLAYYLDGFDANGCLSEGIGYWDYGFSHYVKLAAQLRARTDGELDLLSPPIVEEVARFPWKVQLSPGRFPAFSDAREEPGITPSAAAWLGVTIGNEDLAARGRHAFEDGYPTALRNLLWCRQVPDDWSVQPSSETVFLEGHDWWIARSDPEDQNALVLAAKGGTNGESHNHNDCGSFVVHCNRESLLRDLGLATYHSGLKHADTRYDYLHTRSLGHPVPYVNGYEQGHGEEYRATVLDHAADPPAFELDLADCYPAAAGVETLHRRFAIETDRVTLDDRAQYSDDAPDQRLESVLVSFVPIERRDGGLVVTGERGRARIAVTRPSDPEIAVEHLPDALEVSGHTNDDESYRDVWRARVTGRTRVALEIAPSDET